MKSGVWGKGRAQWSSRKRGRGVGRGAIRRKNGGNARRKEGVRYWGKGCSSSSSRRN